LLFVHYLWTHIYFKYNDWLLYFIVMILYCALCCIICALFDIQTQNIYVRYYSPYRVVPSVCTIIYKLVVLWRVIFFWKCHANLINKCLRFQTNISEHDLILSQNVRTLKFQQPTNKSPGSCSPMNCCISEEVPFHGSTHLPLQGNQTQKLTFTIILREVSFASITNVCNNNPESYMNIIN